jgi:hypothetical protein
MNQEEQKSIEQKEGDAPMYQITETEKIKPTYFEYQKQKISDRLSIDAINFTLLSKIVKLIGKHTSKDKIYFTSNELIQLINSKVYNISDIELNSVLNDCFGYGLLSSKADKNGTHSYALDWIDGIHTMEASVL